MAKLPLRFVGFFLLFVVLIVASCSALYHSIDRAPATVTSGP
ncbi:MAG TPA: hypothetical protein PJ986_17570 [Gammaproteobacteria bacterium]|nr:hypothetical protein [Gammaproteobacteria bacterium]